MSDQSNLRQERPKSKDIRQLARIAGFLRPYRRQIVYASIALVVASASILALG